VRVVEEFVNRLCARHTSSSWLFSQIERKSDTTRRPDGFGGNCGANPASNEWRAPWRD
jgi:hypothetical protein